jgi:type II secretory ATPase GspE/PulE/Tfp pilus assembly ATPase PilB-like protein
MSVEAVGGSGPSAGPEILDECTLCARASGLGVDRVRELATFARDRGQRLAEVLVDRAGVDEGSLLRGLANALCLPFLAEEADAIPEQVLSRVPPGIAVRYRVVPLADSDGRLRLASSRPFDWQTWDDLAQILRSPLEKVLCPGPVIDRMLRACYGLGAETVERLVAGRSEESVQVVTPLAADLSEEEVANEPTVVNLVNQILTEAIRAGATDVHFEPYETKYRVRYRVDGMLEDVAIPVGVRLLKLALVSRLKIMSGLDITEKRLPQDGRCQVSLAGQDYDLRISILPGVHGEGVVVRLQRRQMVELDLDQLGFLDEERERIRRLIGRPHGLMLVTGPTGSGKTTTLYACLNKIIAPEVKIITVEDPVEYWTQDILQMQVDDGIGFSFARALRHMLRHDPDIMLVGEIRDRETADIAVRSSLTGHLVFATLHTNDAASAIPRLVDIGIEPFLVASSVHGILAQRLVRKICRHCKCRVDPNDLSDWEQQLVASAGWTQETPLWRGAGCEKCRFTGYLGRTAVGEVAMVSPTIRRLVQESAPTEQIRKVARQEGTRTLQETALIAVRNGTTSVAEVLRVTQDDQS